MDLWLSSHDARVRSLRAGGKLSFSFGTSPVGDCVALMVKEHLIALRFIENREEAIASLQAEWPTCTLHPSEEGNYLIERAFRNPESIPLMAIGTPFQLTVWEYLRQTPSAVTLTYGELAEAIGRPKAARAVGGAVGANKIAILIPCHRVVSRGKLTGYRWGIERKRTLLAWELNQRDPLKMPF